VAQDDRRVAHARGARGVREALHWINATGEETATDWSIMTMTGVSNAIATRNVVGSVPLAARPVPDILEGMELRCLHAEVRGRNDRQRFTPRCRSFEVVRPISLEGPISTLFDEARMRNVLSCCKYAALKHRYMRLLVMIKILFDSRVTSA